MLNACKISYKLLLIRGEGTPFLKGITQLYKQPLLS